MMDVKAAVGFVSAGSRAHVDVRAAGRSLLRIVHRSIHANFLNRFRSRCGQRLSDGQIRRCRGLNHPDARAGHQGDPGIVHNPGGSHLAGALAIEDVAGVHSIQQKTVAGVTLAIGPDRLVAQAGVGAAAAGKFRIDTGRKNGEPRKAARGQGNGLNLGLIKNVAVGGINGIHQRRFLLHRDRSADLPDFQRDVYRGGTIGLHQNRRNGIG